MVTQPIVNIDGIRNMLVLSRDYHNNVNEQARNDTGVQKMGGNK